jgi:hypothetical protein
MADKKAAVRAKMYRDRKRRHEQGDHTCCVVGNCVVVTPESITSPVTPDGPVTGREAVVDEMGLSARGRRLWDEMTAGNDPSPLHREMLLEACRMADRLERLDRHLKGEDWLRFWSRNDDGTRVEVIVDKLLTEARELQSAFRMAVTDLVKAFPPKKEPKGGGVLADLAAKRAARSAQTAG